jgi:predicted regulator of Ras-like GTPase activity (Roadblock/LC7/MglB family)
VSPADDALGEHLAPYRRHEGILAALLISRDGFVVAADADPGVPFDAVAAQAAGMSDLCARLAVELDQVGARYVFIEFEGLNVVLAPFGEELTLALVGRPDALTCDVRLSDGGA